MSQPFSNQPFPNQPGAPLSGGPTPGGYAEAPFGQPPPQKSSRWWVWILGGCGCSTLLLILCCGGIGYWTVAKGGKLVGGAIKEQLEKEIAGNDDVAEHLGDIQSLSMDFIESGKETQSRGGGANWLVLNAEGEKGNGTFVVQPNDDPKAGEKFNKIELRLPDGKTIQIKPPPE